MKDRLSIDRTFLWPIDYGWISILIGRSHLYLKAYKVTTTGDDGKPTGKSFKEQMKEKCIEYMDTGKVSIGYNNIQSEFEL